MELWQFPRSAMAGQNASWGDSFLQLVMSVVYLQLIRIAVFPPSSPRCDSAVVVGGVSVGVLNCAHVVSRYTIF